ncbi:amino acid deaminase/aldolase [Cryptosporangium phraense]|uniref:Amino acid deaminase/aldolase n=1 Tax=Cryptosporangium phraense TaxID=2593070 RepID=A0A545AW41_9ACTN|nr:amino acid deaminase/aldolase [Cryptosporangium phraense]TQS45556.1 amino acid deaminase/aldolase [Cryptosporangium phraense]
MPLPAAHPAAETEPRRAHPAPAQPRTRGGSPHSVEKSAEPDIEPRNHLSPEATFARLETATAHLEPPFAILDRSAFRANAVALTRRAAGTPIRIASKSVRCRTALIEALSLDGFAGVLGYTLPEALWLAAGEGASAFSDVVVGYPTANRAALKQLADDERLAGRVTLMIDSIDQLDLIDEVAPPGRRAELQVCLDLDSSLRIGRRVHIGVRRSPVHTPADAAVLARRVALRPGFRITGVMSYEAQIAGVGDAPPGRFFRGLAVRWMQRRSWKELLERRATVIDAVQNALQQVGAEPLRFVNAGGTGSVEKTAADPVVTEVAAGSGLYGPTLFDTYRAFTPRPAAMFAVQVVRRPARGWVTAAGGGWIASGPPGPDRLPTPVFPPNLTMAPTEMAGEVQTPLHGDAADALKLGDRVWFRHAKAGELCEHVDVLHVVDGDRVVDVVPTYRGEGRAF